MNVPTVAIWLPVALVVACAMEPWAMLLHGVVWHGPLAFVHRSHHTKRAGTFEWNDALSTLHAPPAIALILFGCRGPEGPLREVLFGVGLGMTLFGMAYVVVHDGFVHERLPITWLARFRYFRTLRACHRAHHRGDADHGPYGLFLGAFEARWHARRRGRARVVSR